MSVFEFVAILYSIVIAMGVARVLAGFVALIEFRKEVAHPPLFVIWLSLLLLMHIVWWFSLWADNDSASYTLFKVVFTFHVPAFLFISSWLLVPGEAASETIAERHAKLRVPFLICLSIPVIPGPLIGAFVTGDWSVALYLLPVGTILLIGTISSNIRLQYSVALSAITIYLIFAAQFRSTVTG
ncbi:MAG: hypothetical protein ACI9ON_003829 [Limisphaerales bacterium]